MPEFHEITWILLIIGVAVLLAGLFSWVNAHTGRQWDPMSIVGAEGVSQSTFSTEGTIVVRGEIWRARVKQGVVEKGDKVIVRSVLPGMLLEVEKP